MRILGLDYGSKRIGVALGDTESRIASPWQVIEVRSRDQVLNEIRDLIQREKIEKMIVGVPKPLGERERENDQVREVRSFIEELDVLNVAVEEEDEVLTSRLAASQMRERGEKGKRDDLAAANILQSWLDRNVLPS